MAAEPPAKRQRVGNPPGDARLPATGRLAFVNVLLAGHEDEAPVAHVAACVPTRDLGLRLAGVSRSLRTAVAATFARWDGSGTRMRGALEERRGNYPTARAEAAATFTEARAALAAEVEAEGGADVDLAQLPPQAMYGPLNYRTAARTLFLRPYLAHFCPVFSRFFAVFSVLTPGFQKVAPKDRGAVP